MKNVSMIGRIAKNSNGRLGLITARRGGEFRGVAVDGKGGWASTNPEILPYNDYPLNVNAARCENGRIGLTRSSLGSSQMRGIGIDGRGWASRYPRFLSWKRVAEVVRNQE